MELLFRFFMYACLGLTTEIVFSVVGLDFALGTKVSRRIPRKYLEGFVSLYMIPIHGIGILFIFEPLYFAIAGWHWMLRFLVWAASFVFAEAAFGFIMDKTLGFYPWDYYADSKYKIFKRGYSLWTFFPLWGLYGLTLEIFVRLFVGISPMLNSLNVF